jgi:hypothetical protein
MCLPGEGVLEVGLGVEDRSQPGELSQQVVERNRPCEENVDTRRSRSAQDALREGVTRDGALQTPVRPAQP